MGDVLRQTFYPLVLPAIVFCVWAHAWAVKQEAGTARTSTPLPSGIVLPHDAPVTRIPGTRTGAYGFSGDDDSVASVDDHVE
jgi:hypothetical protein